MAKRARPTFPCPHCGEPVRRGALACPHCGSDASTGWSDEAETGGVDLGQASDDFDYDAFLEAEFGERKSGPSKRTLGFVLLLALVILALVF